MHLMHMHALFFVHHFHKRALIVVLLCVDAVEILHLLGIVVIESSVWGVKALDPFGMGVSLCLRIKELFTV